MKKRIFGAPTIPAPQDDDSDEGLQPAYVRNKQTNLYSALMDHMDESSSEKEGVRSERDSDSGERTAPAPAASKKNKKKKKKKKANKNEDTGCNEDVDSVIQQVQAMLGEQAPATGTPAPGPSPAPVPPPVPEVQRIDPRKLNVVHEIKRNYQVDVLKEFDNPPERKRSGWFRKTTFVQPKKGWKQVRNTDVHMKLLRTDAAAIEYFVFVHGERYRATQLQYLCCVHNDDRLALEQLLADNPNHIDSRLLVAHVDGMLKRYAESKENIEFALFTLEHVLHKSFDYASGRCRLEYTHFENRAFHILLLKLVRYHYNLACHSTALELCKLLLLLDPADPLGVTLLVDAVALRAAQYSWLIQAIEYWDSQHRALSLPNMGFAYALAHYCLAAQEDDADLLKRAEELVADAISKWPCCLLHILDKCGSTKLRDVRDLPLYANQTRELNGPVLWCLSRLTAERQFPVWKRPDNLAWLERAGAAAGSAREASDAARSRRAVFRRAPPQLLRNLTVLNHSRVQPPDSDTDVQAFPVTDPYPPSDGISPYHVAANPYWRNSGRRHQPFNPMQFLGL